MKYRLLKSEWLLNDDEEIFELQKPLFAVVSDQGKYTMTLRPFFIEAENEKDLIEKVVHDTLKYLAENLSRMKKSNFDNEFFTLRNYIRNMY